MLLHLLNDEKFTESHIDIFENVNPDNNLFLIGYLEDGGSFKHVDSLKEKVVTAKYFSDEYFEKIGELGGYEAVIINGLSGPKENLIRKSSQDVNFVWNSWGYDYVKLLRKNLYSEKTKDLVTKLNADFEDVDWKRWVKKSPLIKIYRKLQFWRRRIIKKKTFKKISYFSTVLPQEADILKEKLHLSAKYVPFNYGHTALLIRQNESHSLSRDKNNILCGNSANPTNNHIDIFDKLGKIELGNRKIITPLSYPGRKEYVARITKLGKQKLGENFQPLYEFIPFQEYFELLTSCAVGIFNHNRQQGGGNINLLLWLGAKVFISEKNLYYDFYNQKSAAVFSFENDWTNSEKDLEPLKPDLQKKNRKIVEGYFGYEAILERAKNYVETITGDSV